MSGKVESGVKAEKEKVEKGKVVEKSKSSEKAKTSSGGAEELGEGLGQWVERPLAEVAVHPLVLLSVVDHFQRVSRGSGKRVVGALMGIMKNGQVLDVSNSFAVPFDEDAERPDVWYLDHDYLAKTVGMFRRVSAKERVVGWYHSGPRLRPNDLLIHDKIKDFCDQPVLLVVEPEPAEVCLPCKAYVESWDQVGDEGKTERSLSNVPTTYVATQAEEIGVEHLARDLREAPGGTLAKQVGELVTGLRGLLAHLRSIAVYLGEVAAGTLPPNHQVNRVLQDALNLVPDAARPHLSAAEAQDASDDNAVLYMAALTQAVCTLHTIVLDKTKPAPKPTTKDPKDKAKDARAKETKPKGPAFRKEGPKPPVKANSLTSMVPKRA